MLTADLFANFIVGVVFLGALVTFRDLPRPGAGLVRLRPRTHSGPLEDIRTYWYNGGRWPEETRT
jgi:MFS transporter, SP family, galactose:H+ symporter